MSAAASPLSLTPLERARAEAVLGWRPAAWRPVFGGYTPARRFVVTDAGRSAFVKVASNPTTADMLRREARAYGAVTGAFMPRFIGWADDAETPLLVIEDLSEAVWPPPWTSARIDQVLAQIEAIHALRVDLPALIEEGWSRLAKDPAPFLSLRIASPQWLREALQTLVDAEAALQRRRRGAHALRHPQRQHLHRRLRCEARRLGGRGARQPGARPRLLAAEPAARGRPAARGDPAGPARGGGRRLGLLRRARRPADHPVGAARARHPARPADDGAAVGRSLARPAAARLTAQPAGKQTPPMFAKGGKRTTVSAGDSVRRRTRFKVEIS